MAPENIGRLATVKARGDFYAFVNGWQGRIVGEEAGCYWLLVEGEFAGMPIEKKFLIPPEELEIEL